MVTPAAKLASRQPALAMIMAMMGTRIAGPREEIEW